MSNNLSFATILKDFGGSTPSRVFLLNGTDSLDLLHIRDIQSIDGIVFFHDIQLLIDDFTNSNLTYPKNTADIGHFSLTLLSYENKKTTKAKSQISSIMGVFDQDENVEKNHIDTYSAAFWGNQRERSDEKKLGESILFFLRHIKSKVELLLAARENRDGIQRYFEIEQPAFSILSSLSVDGLEYSGELVRNKRKLVEKKLYYAVKELSDYTHLPICFPSERDKAKILKYFSNEKVHLDQLESQIEILAEAFPEISKLYDVINLQRELHIFKKIPIQGKALHPIIETYGTTTGRILFKDPELQNISKSNRDILREPTGASFVYLDYDQFEAGILGDLSGCKPLIDLCNSGDLYEDLADKVFGARNYRPIAKTLFLAYSYGMERASLKKLATRKKQGSASKLERYLNQFIAIDDWKNRIYSEVCETGKISTLMGGSRMFKLADGGLTPKQRRSIISQKVQGTASLIFKEALVTTQQKIEPAKIILPMHDAFLIRCGHASPIRIIEIASNCMKEAFKKWCPSIEPRVSASDFFKECTE